MAELSRAHQVLISAATGLCLWRHGMDHERKMRLDIIAEVLPDIARPDGILGDVIQATQSLVKVRSGDRQEIAAAESILRLRLETFFKERLGLAYDRWRAEQVEKSNADAEAQ